MQKPQWHLILASEVCITCFNVPGDSPKEVLIIKCESILDINHSLIQTSSISLASWLLSPKSVWK